MQNLNAISLVLLWAAFPMTHALTVLIWALRQRKGGQL